jgi:hypothetical protein
MKNKFKKQIPLKTGGVGNTFVRFMLGGLFLAATSATALAQPGNDDCTNAIPLTLGAACTIGSNVGATAVPADTVNCTPAQDGWASPADATVWYSVNIPSAGTYSFNLDNGTNQLGEDTQLKLFSGTCSALTLLACSEDAGINATNGLAAVITYNITTPGTYYLMVDIFDVVEGTFCINAYENVTASNDLVTNAIDITSAITGVSGTVRFDQDAYFYNPPSNPNAGLDPPLSSDDPTTDRVDLSLTSGGEDDDCNNPASDTVKRTFRGVWFKFNVPASGASNWISVFPNNGGNLYVASLFSEFVGGTAPVINSTTGRIEGLSFLGCSTGDGLAASGDPAYDKSRCSNLSAARLDLSQLAAGTYYLRVAQFAKVLIDSTNSGEPADPDNGIFNLVIEQAPDAGIGADGLTSDQCPSGNTIGCDNNQPNSNINKTYPNLSNAGMIGNISVVNGGTACATPNSGEPAELAAVAGSSGEFQRNCQGTNFTGTVQHDYNNSGIYQFNITSDTTTVFITDALVQSIINGLFITLQGLTNDPDYQAALAEVRNAYNLAVSTVDATAIATIRDLLITLRAQSINPLVDGTKNTAIDAILAQLDSLFIPVPTPFPCVANVSLRFSNLKTAGVNGNIAFFNVVRADVCSGTSTSVMAGFTNSLDTCIVLRPAAGKLAPGNYSVIVDGEQGQVLNYDLTIDVNYVDSITGIPCGVACSTPLRKAAPLSQKLSVERFAINYVKPVPATDRIELSYSSNSAENVRMTVMNVVGSVVFQGNLVTTSGNNVNSLDISSYKAGIYFLIIEKGNERAFTRFVKSE